MESLHPLCRGSAGDGAHDRLRKGAVESKICLRYLGDGRKAAIICCVVSTQFANVFERSRLAAHHPVAGYEIGIGRAVNLALQYRLVETGRKRLDELNIAPER